MNKRCGDVAHAAMNQASNTAFVSGRLPGLKGPCTADVLTLTLTAFVHSASEPFSLLLFRSV
jgi:hypothetical protein